MIRDVMARTVVALAMAVIMAAVMALESSIKTMRVQYMLFT